MWKLYNASRMPSSLAAQALMSELEPPVASPTPSSSCSLGDVALAADSRAGDRGHHPCQDQAEKQSGSSRQEPSSASGSKGSTDEPGTMALLRSSRSRSCPVERSRAMDSLRRVQCSSGVCTPRRQSRPSDQDGQPGNDTSHVGAAEEPHGQLQTHSGHLFGYAAQDRCGGAAQHVDQGPHTGAPDGRDSDPEHSHSNHNEHNTTGGEPYQPGTNVPESQQPGQRLLKTKNKKSSPSGHALPLFMAKRLMAMTTLVAASMSRVLINLHLEGCDGLWEVACAPHSWLSDAAERRALHPRRINLQQGYDLYKKDTWNELRRLRQQRRPRRLWFSLPCTKWCSWTSVNYNNDQRREQLETDRRKERRMLWEVVKFIVETMDDDPSVQVYFEWPFPCFGWRQQPLQHLEAELYKRGLAWLQCRVDGCCYGLRDRNEDLFVQKKWMIKTTDELFHQRFRSKVCPGNHRHAHIEGQETARTAYYPWKMVESITKFWADQVGSNDQVRQLRRADEESEVTMDEEAKTGLELKLAEKPDELPGEPMDLCVGQAALLEIEAHSKEALAYGRYGFPDCEGLLYLIYNHLGVTIRQDHTRWANVPAQRLQLGVYSFGGFGGVTNQTNDYEAVTKYVNGFLKHHLPQLTWTSLMINFNGRALPHKDHHNLKGSVNVLVGFGPYVGGGLCLQGQCDERAEESRRQMPDGTFAKGGIYDTHHKFVIFNPEVCHASQHWRGLRISISAYSSRMITQLPQEQLQRLRALGFPLPCGKNPTTSILTAEQTSSTTLGPTTSILAAEQTSSTTLGPTTSIPTAEQTSSTTLGPNDTSDGQVSAQLPEGVTQDARQKWTAQVAKFHKAAGHPSNRNLARMLHDAGHPQWKVDVAATYECPTCQSLKMGGTSSGKIPPASTHAQYSPWEAVAVDAAEWVPAGRKVKVKFLLFMDVATKLRVTCPLYVYDFLEMKAESSQDFMQNFTERWLGTYPKPRVVLMDSAKSLISETTHQYLSDLNIMVHFIAEKESWAHGTVEAAVQDVKMTASAIASDIRHLPPELALHLATSALNSTEFTAGFSSFQWAFGKHYSLSDEDVRTFATTGQNDDFTRVITLRQQAEEIAVRTRARRVLSRLHNTTVRQPLREFQPFDLVKIWRHVWPHEQIKGTRGGFRKSGRPHWAGPGRVIFQEVLPHQERGDERRHIVWVLIGQRLFRCSVRSVRPVTEEERFVHETTSSEDPSSWRTLADILPRREYFDVVNEEPGEADRELPELPPEPDSTTQVAPTRRVRAKTTLTTIPPTTDEGTHHSTASSSQTHQREPPDVNDYEQPAVKRSKGEEPSWVEELYVEAEMEKNSMDIFHAMAEVKEFLRIEMDMDYMQSNRQKKMFERNPVAYLAKKMKRFGGGAQQVAAGGT